MLRVRWLTAIVLAGAVAASGSALRAFEIPRWPSEQAARLRVVDRALVRIRKELFAARMQGQRRRRRRLERRRRRLEAERRALLRALNHLPPGEGGGAPAF